MFKFCHRRLVQNARFSAGIGSRAGFDIRQVLANRGIHSRTRNLSSSRANDGSNKVSNTSIFIGGISGTAIGLLALAALIVVDNHNSIIELDSGKPTGRSITPEELLKHTTPETGVWVAINGLVYDLSEFLPMHPGGIPILLKYAGKDASFLFNKVHAANTIENMLPPEAYLGELNGELDASQIDPMEVEERKSEEMRAKRPPLMTVLNISDFEYVAKKILPGHAWAYYSGGSDDEITMRENHSAYYRYYFKPRVLVDVDDADISTTMLNIKTDAPFYCSAAALAQLGHPDGELSIARGVFKENIIQMISFAASYPLDDIIEETAGPKWFQMYVQPDRSECLDMIKHCEETGIKAVFVTVDTPLFGRREKDLRFKMDDNVKDLDAIEVSLKDNNDFILSYEKVGLKWDDIKNFKAHSSIPIVVKGIQTVEDVFLAIENKADAVVLSNHGGRQLDFSRPPIDVLAELMPQLRQKQLEDKIEVYIDGGVRRGSDVLKALCLGAKGVGLGRPFLYANSSYGENGVIKCCRLLKDEIRRDMKLLGVKSIDELNPDLIHAYPAVFNSASNSDYEPLYLPKFREA